VSDARPPLSPQGAAVLSALLGHRAPLDAVTPPLAALLDAAAARAEPLESAALSRALRATPRTRLNGGEPPRALRRLARRWRPDEDRDTAPREASDLQRLAPDGVLSPDALEAMRALDTERARIAAEIVQAVDTARRAEQRRVRRTLMATRALVERVRLEAQRDAVDLALALAERLFVEDPTARAAWAAWLDAAVQTAAARIGPRTLLTAHMHADDVPLWSERLRHLGVQVLSDHRVNAGDLWLSSSEGALDLRRATVLQAVLAGAAAARGGAP